MEKENPVSKVAPFVSLYFSIDDKPFQFDTIWHYTSADGLIGIIHEDKTTPVHFRFTRSDCLNDYSEGKEIEEIYKDECALCLEKKEISQSFYNIIQNVTISKTAAKSKAERRDNELYVTVTIDEWTTYICCFSYGADSLDMWRYYSKNSGGYAIKLHTFNVDEQLHLAEKDLDKKDIDIQYYKVIYDPYEKRKFVHDGIINTYQAFLRECEISDKIEAGVKASYYLKYLLSTFQYRFKNECFKSENEYRCVCFIRNDSELAKELLPVKYRSANGTIVPYIDIAFENKNALISEVMISPFVKEDYAESTVKQYLSSCGLKHCKVTKSKLPLRF